ncbi:MAG: stage II sporulation protein M [Pikeienuella sp.]
MDDNIRLRSARFRAEREADWRRLSTIVTRAEQSGVRALSFEDARDMAALYRQAVNSLSVAREISLDKSLLAYLEALTARAYLAVYAPQETLGGLFSRFFRTSAPQAMRRSAPYILLGGLALFLGALCGYLLFMEDEAWFYVFVGGDTRNPLSTVEELRASIYDEYTGSLDGLGAFASYLFSHNTRIAIFVFALGVFAALPSFLLAFYNGLFFGAFVALYVQRGLGWDIFGWISIHGVTELSAIIIATGAGLKLGSAVLFPGRRLRSEALRDEGRDAVKLAVVAGVMLLVAGLLEGFGRQLVQDLNTRLIIGWGIGALWLAWFILGGRNRGQDHG